MRMFNNFMIHLDYDENSIYGIQDMNLAIRVVFHSEKFTLCDLQVIDKDDISFTSIKDFFLFKQPYFELLSVIKSIIDRCLKKNIKSLNDTLIDDVSLRTGLSFPHDLKESKVKSHNASRSPYFDSSTRKEKVMSTLRHLCKTGIPQDEEMTISFLQNDLSSIPTLNSSPLSSSEEGTTEHDLFPVNNQNVDGENSIQNTQVEEGSLNAPIKGFRIPKKFSLVGSYQDVINMDRELLLSTLPSSLANLLEVWKKDGAINRSPNIYSSKSVLKKRNHQSFDIPYSSVQHLRSTVGLSSLKHQRNTSEMVFLQPKYSFVKPPPAPKSFVRESMTGEIRVCWTCHMDVNIDEAELKQDKIENEMDEINESDDALKKSNSVQEFMIVNNNGQIESCIDFEKHNSIKEWEIKLSWARFPTDVNPNDLIINELVRKGAIKDGFEFLDQSTTNIDDFRSNLKEKHQITEDEKEDWLVGGFNRAFEKLIPRKTEIKRRVGGHRGAGWRFSRNNAINNNNDSSFNKYQKLAVTQADIDKQIVGALESQIDKNCEENDGIWRFEVFKGLDGERRGATFLNIPPGLPLFAQVRGCNYTANENMHSIEDGESWMYTSWSTPTRILKPLQKNGFSSKMLGANSEFKICMKEVIERPLSPPRLDMVSIRELNPDVSLTLDDSHLSKDIPNSTITQEQANDFARFFDENPNNSSTDRFGFFHPFLPPETPKYDSWLDANPPPVFLRTRSPSPRIKSSPSPLKTYVSQLTEASLNNASRRPQTAPPASLYPKSNTYGVISPLRSQAHDLELGSDEAPFSSGSHILGLDDSVSKRIIEAAREMLAVTRGAHVVCADISNGGLNSNPLIRPLLSINSAGIDINASAGNAFLKSNSLDDRWKTLTNRTIVNTIKGNRSDVFPTEVRPWSNSSNHNGSLNKHSILNTENAKRTDSLSEKPDFYSFRRPLNANQKELLDKEYDFNNLNNMKPGFTNFNQRNKGRIVALKDLADEALGISTNEKNLVASACMASREGSESRRKFLNAGRNIKVAGSQTLEGRMSRIKALLVASGEFDDVNSPVWIPPVDDATMNLGRGQWRANVREQVEREVGSRLTRETETGDVFSALSKTENNLLHANNIAARERPWLNGVAMTASARLNQAANKRENIALQTASSHNSESQGLGLTSKSLFLGNENNENSGARLRAPSQSFGRTTWKGLKLPTKERSRSVMAAHQHENIFDDAKGGSQHMGGLMMIEKK